MPLNTTNQPTNIIIYQNKVIEPYILELYNLPYS